MKVHRLVLMIVATSLVTAGARAVADEESWIGESVLPTKRSKEIKFGDWVDGEEVYFSFAPRFPLKVRDDRDGWLRIHDGHRVGWTHKADFVRVRDAPAYFNRRVEANPNDSWALFMRGKAWLEKGELGKAIKDFDECLRRDPTDAASLINRSAVRSRKKEYDEAIRDCDEAIRLDPENAVAYMRRGLNWEAKGEYDKAIRDYNEAIRLDPKYTGAFNDRGNAWKDKGEYDKAIKDYGEVIRLDPQHAVAFYNRGNAWEAKGEYDKAIKDYDQAIGLDPKDAVAHFSRAVAQLLARHKEAPAGFQAVLDLQGPKGYRAPYAVILGHLAARQTGDAAAAKRFLDNYAGKLELSWPYPVVLFLRGDIDEPALLMLSTDDERRTEARCYLGLDHVLRGRKDQARVHFRWVKEHGNPQLVEYTIALAELERLNRP